MDRQVHFSDRCLWQLYRQLTQGCFYFCFQEVGKCFSEDEFKPVPYWGAAHYTSAGQKDCSGLPWGRNAWLNVRLNHLSYVSTCLRWLHLSWLSCLFFLVMERNCPLLKGIKLNYHGHLFQHEMTGHVGHKWKGTSISSLLHYVHEN